MKKCELCQQVAKIHCHSDQASLCWDCDTKVHTANFIVENHLRTLLCHVCQDPTRWTASGPELDPTIFFCHGCAKTTGNHEDDVDSNSNSNDNRSNNNDDEDEEEEEDLDIQIVPMVSRSSSEISSLNSDCSSSNDSSM